MRRFRVVFEHDIVVKADTDEEAMNKIDSGEVIRAGFKTNKNGVQYDFYELPSYHLVEINPKKPINREGKQE